MERHYVYQALKRWRNIRLLRLLPSMHSSETLHGQLFECALENVHEQAFPYEALSYVWGDAKTRHVIKIDGLDLPVTANLHSALKRLREKRRERLLWIDALCIDQRNDEEKEHQIQLMYQIYACASCVIVWLGEEDDESDQALEDLRIIGRKDEQLEDLLRLGMNGPTTREKNDRIMQRIGKMFQRAWFRRIWVLQEVGAARLVQIRCGNVALNGYAFALAASRLHELFRVRGASQALQRTIQSTAYLIKGSIFRAPYQAAEAPSARVGSFGELVDMFHDREATVAHDKIYALLGMSSDDMSESGLLPDYRVTRGQLFQNMVEFVMSDKISVECRNDKEVAVIKARGNVLGHVSHISEDSISANTQTVSVKWSDEVQSIWHNKGGHDASLMIQAPAIPLKQGDIICILDGAKALTIIRLYQDFSAIVSATTTPREMDWRTRFESLERSKLPVYNLVLIWDWNYHPDSYCRWGDYEVWAKCNDWVSAGPTFVAGRHLDVLSRQCELALICLEILGPDHMKERLEEVLSPLDAILQAEKLQTTARRIISALLCGVAGRHSDASDSKRSRQALHKRRKSRNRISMLLYWAMEKRCKILPRIIMETGFLDVDLYGSRAMTVAAACGYLDVVDLLLREGAELDEEQDFYDSDATELKSSIFPNGCETTALRAAAGAGHLMIVERLLREKADVDHSSGWKAGRTALQAAAKGGHVSVVKRLLQENADVNAPACESHGLTALQAAAKGGHVSVVKRLLQEKADVNAPACESYGLTALQAAAGAGCMTVVELLIQEKADVNAAPDEDLGRTALQKAAGAGHILVVERLLQEKADINAPAGRYRGRTALQAAAGGGHISVVERLLQKKADINAPAGENRGRTALQAASEGGHILVVERLLQEKADVNERTGKYCGKTALQAAAGGGHVSVVERLLQKKADVNAPACKTNGRTALMAAAEGGHLAVLELLLEAKVEVNPEDSSHNTALGYASRKWHLAVVKRLKEAGAIWLNNAYARDTEWTRLSDSFTSDSCTSDSC